MGVRESLICRPRESSGSVSANRFDFQRDWALCRLFELQESGTDYVLVMEHHDDIVLLDSSDAPTAVDCYQVKTADSHWSIKDLLRQKSGKTGKANSIVGKMYANCIIFDAETHPSTSSATMPTRSSSNAEPRARDRRRSPSVNSKPL